MDVTLTIPDDQAAVIAASFPDVRAYLQARVTQFVETFVIQKQATSADAVTAAFLAATPEQQAAILEVAGVRLERSEQGFAIQDIPRRPSPERIDPLRA